MDERINLQYVIPTYREKSSGSSGSSGGISSGGDGLAISMMLGGDPSGIFIGIGIVIFIFLIIPYIFTVNPLVNAYFAKEVHDKINGDRVPHSTNPITLTFDSDERDRVKYMYATSVLSVIAGTVIAITLGWLIWTRADWKKVDREDNWKIFNLANSGKQRYLTELTFDSNDSNNLVSYKNQSDTTQFTREFVDSKPVISKIEPL